MGQTYLDYDYIVTTVTFRAQISATDDPIYITMYNSSGDACAERLLEHDGDEFQAGRYVYNCTNHTSHVKRLLYEQMTVYNVIQQA